MQIFYPNFSEPKFYKYLFFEMNSWIGRKLFKKSTQFNQSNQPFLVDLGAGDNYVEGWIHVNFFRGCYSKNK